MRSGLLAWLIWMAVAWPLAAQSPDELIARGASAGADVQLMGAVQERAARSGLDERATVRLLAPAVSAAEAGLPSRMLLQKGLEGLSKGVRPELIARVVADLRGGLERAAGLVDPWMARPGVPEALGAAPGTAAGARREAGPGARGRLLESVGLALQTGAPPEAVGALLDRVPAGLRAPEVSAVRLGVAIEVLADLPVAARSPDVAADLVLGALNSEFAAADLRELPAALEAAGRRGRLPAEAVARGAMAQMEGGLPATAVLENLFQGEFPGKAGFELPPGIEKARERGKGQGPPPP